jgi:hypothetical protein
MVEADRPQTAVWRLRIACWISKATSTHTQYVIHIASPRKQWLPQGYVYAYAACHVRYVTELRMFVHVGMLYCLVLKMTPPQRYTVLRISRERESRFRDNVFPIRSADCMIRCCRLRFVPASLPYVCPTTSFGCVGMGPGMGGGRDLATS